MTTELIKELREGAGVWSCLGSGEELAAPRPWSNRPPLQVKWIKLCLAFFTGISLIVTQTQQYQVILSQGQNSMALAKSNRNIT